jgi:MFS family permease
MLNAELPSDHHLRFHRRQSVIYLLGCTAMAIGTIVAVLTPGQQPNFVLVPTGAFFALMILLSLVERVRHREDFEREKQRIGRDEWMLQGMNRSRGFAFVVIIFAQVPLMFLMAYFPSEPSVEASVLGMGCMTVALGCGVWAASYLYYTHENPDG